MAFSNKFGSLLRQSISQSGQVPVMSMLNSVCYMSTKLFVGGLSYNTDDQSLRDAFANFGDVVESRIITDRETGRSRGFGFVNFTSDESASSALSAMDGQELHGRNIRVSYANDRPSTPRSYDSNSFGGNYRGDGGNADY